MHLVQNIPVQYFPHVFDISLVNPAVKTTRAFNSHPSNFVIQQQAKEPVECF